MTAVTQTRLLCWASVSLSLFLNSRSEVLTSGLKVDKSLQALGGTLVDSTG